MEDDGKKNQSDLNPTETENQSESLSSQVNPEFDPILIDEKKKAAAESQPKEKKLGEMTVEYVDEPPAHPTAHYYFFKKKYTLTLYILLLILITLVLVTYERLPVLMNSQAKQESSMISEVNRLRAEYHLPLLITDEGIASIARDKAEYLSQAVNEDDPEGAGFGELTTIFIQKNIQYRTFAELLGKSYPRSEKLVQAWRVNTVMRNDLLAEEYTHIGAGFSHGHGDQWVLLLLRKKGFAPRKELDLWEKKEREAFRLTNIERGKNGLPPLQWDEKLHQIARIKSADMRVHNYFEHESPTLGTIGQMMMSHGYYYKEVAENIAQGMSTPESVVSGWMGSPGHRANIMNKEVTMMAVGYDPYSDIWTQHFALPMTSSSSNMAIQK